MNNERAQTALSTFGRVFAGCSSSIMAIIATNPLDLLKVILN